LDLELWYGRVRGRHIGEIRGESIAEFRYGRGRRVGCRGEMMQGADRGFGSSIYCDCGEKFEVSMSDLRTCMQPADRPSERKVRRGYP
jgi:hypothetical protein